MPPTSGITKFTSAAVAVGLLIGGVTGAYFERRTSDSGVSVVTTTEVVYGSGGVLPLLTPITLTEVNGSASGTFAFQNPYDFTLLCDIPVIDITTAASPITRVDVYVGTGSLAQTGGTGANLADNFNLGVTGTFALTGSSIVNLGEKFKLFPYGTTASNTHINLVSRHGTGAGLVANLFTSCFGID